MKMKKAVRMPLRRPPQRPRSSPLRARAATVDEAYDEDEDYGAEEEPNMKFSHALFVVLVLHIIAVGGVFAFNWMKTRQGGDAPVAAKAAEKPRVETARPEVTATAPAPAPAAKAPALEGWTGKTHTVRAGDTLTHIAATYKTSVTAIEKANDITSYSMLRVGQVLRVPGTEKSAKPAEAPKSSSTKEAFLATRTEPAKPAGTIAAVVRPAGGTDKPAADKPAETTASGSTPDFYVVAKGDNPYTIAKRFHVSYKALLEVNDIEDATKVQIGQKLKIPKN